MNKLQNIIKEGIDNYVNKIIRESSINVLDDAKNEFLQAIQNNPLTLSVGRGDIEIPSQNFTFFINYELTSEAYYDQSYGNYDTAPWGETYNDDKYEITYFNVTAMDEESGMDLNFVPDDDMFSIIKQSISVDYDGYDMPSKDEYMDNFRDI